MRFRLGGQSLVLAAWITVSLAVMAAATPPPGTAPVQVERLDPRINAIVPQGAQLEKLATGYVWLEGPVWIDAGYLLFADIPGNSIRKMLPDGQAGVFLQPSGYKESAPYTGSQPGSNGMSLDASGRLLVAGNGSRSIYRLESLSPNAVVTVLADEYQGKRLNSPNDVVSRSDGSVYFTDPPYGLPKQNDQDPWKQLTVNGVYRIPAAADQKPGAPPDRAKLQLLVSDLSRPNGLAFSPDEKYLYVNNTAPQKIWRRYTVQPDGSLSDMKLFFDATSDKRPGSPDGMKVDAAGNLYSTGPGGIWIFAPDGTHLGTILTPKTASNVAWGGSDYKTLYITDTDSVYRIRLSAQGLPPRPR